MATSHRRAIVYVFFFAYLALLTVVALLYNYQHWQRGILTLAHYLFWLIKRLY